MTQEDFVQSTERDSEPPEELKAELKALWLAKNDRWHESHDIAQDISSATGYWIHALLHTIEGDLGNAGYWYSKAGQSPIQPDEVDEEWSRIVRSLFKSA